MTSSELQAGVQAEAGEAAGPLLHIVLHNPEIPQNTGNIGRTCVAIGARLWLIRPLGFRVDDTSLKRAGLDYWQYLDWEVVDHWEQVQKRLPESRVWCLTKTASRTVWEVDYCRGDILLFGCESRGLPASLLEVSKARNLKLPMRPEVRSLNLSSAVTAVAYEAVRQLGGIG
ncbi:MAG: tRNA (cytidine(34)-2'-O)-methyltransferase [Planctomycetota bacterium]